MGDSGVRGQQGSNSTPRATAVPAPRLAAMPALTDVLATCQGDRADEWRVIPGGEPGTDLLAGVFETRDSSTPALTALSHNYRAVHLPDPSIGIGWGMESEEWTRWFDSAKTQGVDPNPDWIAPDWSDIYVQWAQVLLNGTMVWRVRYAYVNRGAGADGYLPWPTPIYERVPGDDTGLDQRRVGWRTTRWQLSFALLLNRLQGNAADF